MHTLLYISLGFLLGAAILLVVGTMIMFFRTVRDEMKKGNL